VEPVKGPDPSAHAATVVRTATLATPSPDDLKSLIMNFYFVE
jgi:hypothetical protein